MCKSSSMLNYPSNCTVCALPHQTVLRVHCPIKLTACALPVCMYIWACARALQTCIGWIGLGFYTKTLWIISRGSEVWWLISAARQSRWRREVLWHGSVCHQHWITRSTEWCTNIKVIWHHKKKAHSIHKCHTCVPVVYWMTFPYRTCSQSH